MAVWGFDVQWGNGVVFPGVGSCQASVWIQFQVGTGASAKTFCFYKDPEIDFAEGLGS